MDVDTVNKQLLLLRHLLLMPNTDVSWSSYNGADEVISDLDNIQEGLLINDKASKDRLRLMLAPTGALQEISLSSGWGNEFLEIAESIEKAL